MTTNWIEAAPLLLVMEGETLGTNWQEFVTENDLDAYPEWRDAIMRSLSEDGVYHGGGGAQPTYRLLITLRKGNHHP